MNAYLVFLEYDITFRDSDEGNCYAGEGRRLLKGFTQKPGAEAFVEALGPAISEASKETIVFPRQSGNRKVHAKLGFYLQDIDSACDFRLRVVEVGLEEG